MERTGDSDGRTDGSGLAEGNEIGDADGDGDGEEFGWTVTSRYEAVPVGMTANCVGSGDPSGRVDSATATAPPTKRTPANSAAPIASPPGTRPGRGMVC